VCIEGLATALRAVKAGGVVEERERIVTYTCHACGSRGVDPPKSKKGNFMCPECGERVEISEKRVVKKKEK